MIANPMHLVSMLLLMIMVAAFFGCVALSTN